MVPGMALARFKDLCMDAGDPARLGEFWAQVLGLSWQPDDDGEGLLRGPTRQHTIWVNRVLEPKTVKHRVHLDIYAKRLADLEALGSAVLRPEGDDRPWTVMADPEGGEYCAFLREELPADRLHGLVVDCAAPAAQAEWWGRVYGAPVVHSPRGHSTVEKVPGMPILTMDFTPVPEPKTVKNRIHWDVTVTDVQPLIDAGATLVRPPDEDIGWHVLADPEGNEFCAFTEESSAGE
jgi:Glyoxalase-like domain